jgi:hypothetical protein
LSIPATPTGSRLRCAKHGDSVEVKHYDGFGHVRIVSALPLRGHSTVLADVSAFIDSH